MSQARRIVPDASVVLPVFIHEDLTYRGNTFDLTRRTAPLGDAIRDRHVVTIAPELLRQEFLKAIADRVWPRSGVATLDRDVANRHVERFLSLPVRYVSEDAVAETAWRLIADQRISTSDAWYVATAICHDAELWISHDHADGLVAKAREVHDRVFVLTETRFA